MKGPVDFARLKFSSSLRAENAPLVHQRLMNLSPITKNQMVKYLRDRVVILKESLLAKATLSRRRATLTGDQPYEARLWRDDES